MFSEPEGRVVGWAKLKYPLSLGRGAGVRATEFILIILPLPLGEGRGEGAKTLPAHRYKMFLLAYFPAQSAGERDAVASAVVYHCLTVG